MSFQSYLFNQNFRKLALELGICTNISLVNISDKNSPSEICKYLNNNEILMDTDCPDTKDNKLLTSFINQRDNLFKFIQGKAKDVSFTNVNEILKEGVIKDISHLNGSIDIFTFFYENKGMKSVISSQMVKTLELMQCDVRRLALSIDTYVMYMHSYIRSMNMLNIKLEICLTNNLDRMSRLLCMLRLLDRELEIESKNLSSLFSSNNSIGNNLHISGYRYTSDMYYKNINYIYIFFKNLRLGFIILLLTLVMFVIMTIMYCLVLFGKQITFLNSQALQIGNKIKETLFDMS